MHFMKANKNRFIYLIYFSLYSILSLQVYKKTYPTIGVNDDEFFAQLVSGSYTGMPESQVHIANASPQWIFGLIVSSFFKINANISWYFIILALTVITSVTIITFVTHILTQNLIPIIFATLLSSVILIWYIQSPTYTASAFYSGTAGFFSLAVYLFDKSKTIFGIIAALLISWSISTRTESFIGVLSLFLILILIFIITNRSRKNDIIKNLIWISLLPILTLLINFTAFKIQFSDQEWKDYQNFESARYTIQDNEIERIISEDPSKYGWEEYEYRLFDSYNFLYKDPFTGQKLIKIIDETNITPASIFDSKFDDFVNRIETKFKSFDFIIKSGFIFLTLTIIQLLLNKKRQRIKDLLIYTGFGFIIFAILGIYISIYLRLPERVFFPFMTMLPFLFMFSYILIFYRNNEIKSNKLTSTIFAFILLFAVAFDSKEDFNQSFFFKTNPAYRSFWGEQSAFLQSLGSNKILIGNASQFRTMWSDPYKTNVSLNNLQILQTGWYTFSPYWNNKARNLGLNPDNLIKSLLDNPDTIWMSDDEYTKVISEAIQSMTGNYPKVEKIGSVIFDQAEYAAYKFSDVTN